MDIDDFKSKNGLNLACLVSGIVFSALAFYVFWEISSMEIFNFTEETRNGLKSIVMNISFVAAAFIIGFFIQGIRYLGFNYYIKIYQKAQPNRRAGKKYPGIRQRILFYVFRNGTTVEECLDCVMRKYTNPSKKLKTNILFKKFLDKRHRPEYKWIQESKNAEKDMWIHATKINRIAPQDDIYRFYNWSEVFQCLDTVFLFFSIVVFFLTIAKAADKISSSGFQPIIVILMPMAAVLACIFFHVLSKGCAKMYARRFLYQIEKSLESYKDLS